MKYNDDGTIKEFIVKAVNTNIKNETSTSTEDTYSCDYINNLTDEKDYVFTSINELAPTYSFSKIGKIIYLNINATFLESITVNTWTNLGSIPQEIAPDTAIVVPCILGHSLSGEIIGHGRCEIGTNGTIRVKVNTTSTARCFINCNFVWSK